MAVEQYPIEIVMPRMGLTMEEGVVIAWLKEAGQPVIKGEALMEIETDKATVSIESPANGVLGEVLIKAGQSALVGEVIGYLLEPGEETSASEKSVTMTRTALAPSTSQPAPQRLSPQLSLESQKTKASPAARSLARKLGVELAQIKGSGPGGRIVAWNVAEAEATRVVPAIPSAPQVKATPLAQRVATDLNINLANLQGSGVGGRITRQDVERVRLDSIEAQKSPLTRQHRLMAERMATSFSTAPHFYLHVEVDARSLTSMRAKLQPKLESRSGVHLTFTDLLIKFCALTLTKHPRLIAQWSEDGLIQPQEINIGLAMDTPTGLVVPVIHQIDRLGLVEIARQRNELYERAQTGKLTLQDLELGVFTITNLGMFGIDSFDAILNPPQAAILAVGRIKERALVEAGQIIAAPMMNLSLSVDHRVLDGAAGARFLSDLVEMLETPDLALA